jgi:hypothetical protein
MSRMLELPDPIYDALQRAALEAGMTPEAWIAAHLPEPATSDNGDEADPDSEKTLADLFAGRVGRISSGGRERLSENRDELFTEYLEKKRRAGSL